MNDQFEKKVRAAAVAGWWVVLIAVAFLTLQWLIYLAVMSTHPAWLLSLWGPGVDWPFVQNVWFWAMVAFKFCVWLMVLAVLWLALLGRQLPKIGWPATKRPAPMEVTLNIKAVFQTAIYVDDPQ